MVTPDTLLHWYRKRVAQKYDGSAKRGPGRPPIAGEIERLTMQKRKQDYLAEQAA